MRRPRRVLEVLGKSAGGIAAHAAEITNGLDGRDGLEITLAAPPDLEVRMPKEVIPVTIPQGVMGHRAAVDRLREVIAGDGIDVVHAHGLRAAIDSGRAVRGTPAIALATIHNLVVPEIAGAIRARLYRRAEPLAVRWSHHVFAPSADIALRLREAAPRQAMKVEVLHLGVAPPSRPPQDRDQVRADLGLSSQQPLVVTVARLAPQKALDVLLRALARLPERVHLAIVGSGPLESELKALAGELDLGGRVTFLGYRSEPQDVVAAADVFALSSVWEACSLAAQEAITLGVPVVATRVGGMPELIKDGVSGRLVPRGDAPALAGALEAVLAAPAEAARMAANAATHLEQHFSRTEMLRRLERAYRGSSVAAP